MSRVVPSRAKGHPKAGSIASGGEVTLRARLGFHRVLASLGVGVLFLLRSSCSSSPPARSPLDAWRQGGAPAFFAGVALGLFGHPPDPSVADSDMGEIAALGAPGIVLPVFWRSENVSSTEIE